MSFRLFYSLIFLGIATSTLFAQSTPAGEKRYDELLKERPAFNRDMLRKYYFVDEWATSPHADERKFVLIDPGPEPMGIYDNKEMKGEAKFFLNIFGFSQNLKDKKGNQQTNGECTLRRKHSKKRVKEWIGCETTPCRKIKNVKNLEIDILDPYHYSWNTIDKNKIVSCQLSIPFQRYVENAGMKYGERQYYYLKPLDVTDSVIAFEMEGKTYYLDVRGYSRDKDKDEKKIIDHWTKPLKYSDFDLRWIQTKESKTIEEIEALFKRIQACGVKKDRKCLTELTFTQRELSDPENAGFYRVYPSRPVNWTDENIKEVMSCARAEKILDSNDLYFGDKKKCVFDKKNGKYKVYTIDIPEGIAKSLTYFDYPKFEVVE